MFLDGAGLRGSSQTCLGSLFDALTFSTSPSACLMSGAAETLPRTDFRGGLQACLRRSYVREEGAAHLRNIIKLDPSLHCDYSSISQSSLSSKPAGSVPT